MTKTLQFISLSSGMSFLRGLCACGKSVIINDIYHGHANIYITVTIA